jgi:hypothetical protein
MRKLTVERNIFTTNAFKALSNKEHSFSKVLPNQEINLREEKVVQMYYLVFSVNLRNVSSNAQTHSDSLRGSQVREIV